MTSSFQQLREKIPLYLNGSLSRQQAIDFRLEVSKHPQLEQELAEFSAIEQSFAPIDLPDDEQFNNLFKQIETKVNQAPVAEEQVKQTTPPESRQGWLDKFRDLFSNPFVAWGVALAQFAIVAVIVFQTPTEDSDIRYQSLSVDTLQHTASINVVFTETTTLAQLNALLLEYQLQIISGPGRGKAYRLGIKQGVKLDDVVQQLRQSDNIRFVEKTGAE